MIKVHDLALLHIDKRGFMPLQRCHVHSDMIPLDTIQIGRRENHRKMRAAARPERPPISKRGSKISVSPPSDGDGMTR